MAKKPLIEKGRKILIGVVHLLPLPGAPRWSGDIDQVIRAALDDARAYEEGGADAVIIENFGDVPFTKSSVPPETVAAMAVAGSTLRAAIEIPMGFNVLRNDGLSALALCAACGGDFLRVNVLAGAMVTDQGQIEGDAFNLLRKRQALAPHVKILADVLVKHAVPLGDLSIEVASRDTVERGLADALIVSGTGTGDATRVDDVQRVRIACPDSLILLGSGVTASNAAEYLPFADGFIVGTSVKKGGHIHNPVDPKRVIALRSAMDR
jgi:membrane complex biogenesis BtpA family protein